MKALNFVKASLVILMAALFIAAAPLQTTVFARENAKTVKMDVTKKHKKHKKHKKTTTTKTTKDNKNNKTNGTNGNNTTKDNKNNKK